MSRAGLITLTAITFSFRIAGSQPAPADAEGLLKPNAYLHRVYINPVRDHRVELLLVQCRDARDMQGHYPPICYPSHGCQMPLPGNAEIWNVGNAVKTVQIPGREYQVTFPGGQQIAIRNFFVLPNGKMVRDMNDVTTAAKDYRELVYGVAQVQLLFDGKTNTADRNEIFAQVIGSNLGLIDMLRDGVQDTQSAGQPDLIPRGQR